jgi:hypothetical protein
MWVLGLGVRGVSEDPKDEWNEVGEGANPGFIPPWANDTTEPVLPMAYTVDENSVDIRGRVTGGIIGTPIFTLPENARPAQAVVIPTDLVTIAVAVTGAVSISAAVISAPYTIRGRFTL